MKIALYLRVSSNAQDFNRQKTDLTKKVIDEGNEVAFTFSDKLSGFKELVDRPDLEKLLLLTKEDIDAVYISELSRLSRNPTKLGILIDHFTERKINVYSHIQNINTLNKEGQKEFTTDLIIAVLSQMSSYEIKTKNERVASGNRESVLIKGNSYTHKPAFGYKNELKKLVIHEQESKIVKEIFNRYAKGESIKQLVQYLNLNKIPTRNTDFMIKEDFKVSNRKTINKSEIKWGKSSVRNILRNTVYCGYKEIKGGQRIITPAIISEELFNKCKDEIKDRITNTDKSLRNNFMLRGFFICGECGKQFLGTRSHSDLLYKCSDKKQIKSNNYIGCNNTSILKLHVEPMIYTAVKGAYIQLRTEQIKKGNIETLSNSIKDFDTQIELIDKKITEFKNEAERLVKLYLKGFYDEMSLDKEQRIINNEVESLNRNRNKYLALKIESLNTLEAIKGIDSKPFDLVEVDNSYDLQKEAVKELIKEVIIYKVDNKYTVFHLVFKAGYSYYIIREVWTKKYHVIEGSLYSFNPLTMLFTSKGINNTVDYSFDTVTINHTPIELFKELNRQSKIEEILTDEQEEQELILNQ